MKFKKFIQTNKHLLLNVIAILIGIVLTVTFAYFVTESNGSASTDVNVSTGDVDTLIFDNGDPIEITMTQFNFGEGAKDLTSTTLSTATLTNKSGGSTATNSYAVYFEISENTFQYSDTENNTAELILTIIDPEGNEIKVLDGYNYVTSASGVTGFDVTEVTEDILITDNYAIEADTTTVDEWEVTLSLINLDVLQNDNLNKTFNCKLVLIDEIT